MDKKAEDKIAAFDTIFTNNHIQMMKIIIHYCDRTAQKQLAVFIKYMEFQHTISSLRTQSYELSGCSSDHEERNIGALCSEILPFCSGEERNKVERIAGMLHSMEMYKEMSKTFEVMKEFFPEGMGSGGTASSPEDTGSSGGFNMNMTDMLMNMLSPEQKSMFEMFGGNNNEPERMDE